MRIRCIDLALNCWIVVAGGCVRDPRVGPVAEARALPADRLRVAVLGGLAPLEDPAARAGILASVEGWRPDVVLLTGDAVARGASRSWRASDEVLGPLDDLGVTWIPVAGPRDARGDHRLDRWSERWSRRLPYTTDLAVGGTTWRVLALDGRPGPGVADEAFWIPKVAGPAAAYDHLIAVSGWPVRAPVPAPGGPARDLVELAQECSDGRLRLVLSGGAGTNAMFAEDGAYGPLLISAGNAGAAGPPIGRDELGSQVAGFAWGQLLDRQRDGEPDAPLRGWWALELTGATAELTFVRWAAAGRPDPTTHAGWTAEAGWRVAPVEPAD